MHSETYQYSHDIDWFFLAGDTPVHVSSNGGLLPRSFYKAKDLFVLQCIIERLEPKYSVEVNIEAVKAVYEKRYAEVNSESLFIPDYINFPNDVCEQWMKAYAWSFIQMASRGFYSYDRIYGSNNYLLVAKPSGHIILPKEIRQLLKTTSELNELTNNESSYCFGENYIQLVDDINRFDTIDTKNNPQ